MPREVQTQAPGPIRRRFRTHPHNGATAPETGSTHLNGAAPAGGPHSVALVHDYLLVMRGAERTFAAIAECWPEAPIYTLLYDEDGHRTAASPAARSTPPTCSDSGSASVRFRTLLPAFPRAVRSLPLKSYDLVVSSSSAFAHAAPESRRARATSVTATAPSATPGSSPSGRWPRCRRPCARRCDRTLTGIRRADRLAAREPTRYVANSAITRRTHPQLLGPCLQRRPPAGRGRAVRYRSTRERYFLVVSRAGPPQARRPSPSRRRGGRRRRCTVVGEGPERARLQAEYGAHRHAGSSAGSATTELRPALRPLHGPCCCPTSRSSGSPRSRRRPPAGRWSPRAGGGALETVIDGETGVLVRAATSTGSPGRSPRPTSRRFDPDPDLRPRRTGSRSPSSSHDCGPRSRLRRSGPSCRFSRRPSCWSSFLVDLEHGADMALDAEAPPRLRRPRSAHRRHPLPRSPSRDSDRLCPQLRGLRWAAG